MLSKVRRILMVLILLMPMVYLPSQSARAADTVTAVIHLVTSNKDLADVEVQLTYADVTFVATTNQNGKATFTLPDAWQGQDARVTTTSRVWQIPDDAYVMVDSTDNLRVTATRVPVIFLPGILGSFLDRNECSVWLGVSVSTPMNDCAILSDKSILNDMSDTNIYATDAVRLFQIEVPDYIYISQLIESITAIDLLGLVDISTLQTLLGIPTTAVTSPEEAIVNRPTIPNMQQLMLVIENILMNPNVTISEVFQMLDVPNRKVIDENTSYRKMFDAMTASGLVPLQENAAPLSTQSPQERCEQTKTIVAANPDELRPTTTFYVFAYDWRKPSTTSASTLATFIDCVRDTHGGGKVNLVGHSLGGIVIQNYLNQYDTSVINRVITLNTPYFGVVRTLDVHATGEFEPVMMLMQLTAPELLQVAPLLFASTQGNAIAGRATIDQIDAKYPALGQAMRERFRTSFRSWPSSKELLPNDDYLAHHGTFLYVDDVAIDDSEAYWATIAQEFGMYVTPQERAHMHQVSDDTLPDTVVRTQYIDYLILYSSNPSTTITSATKKQNVWSYKYGAGDGTVSELSLKRRSLWWDWNPPRINGQRQVVVHGYCNEPMVINGVVQPQNIDHASIISHDDVATQINVFLENEQVKNPAVECVDGYEYSLAGLASRVSDTYTRFTTWVADVWNTYMP